MIRILIVVFVLFNISCAESGVHISDNKVIKIVQSNPKVIEYFGLFSKKTDSGSVMYLENNPKEDSSDYYKVYVGEKFFKDKRYVRAMTFYYNYKTKILLEYDVLNDSNFATTYNLLMFSKIEVDSFYDGYNLSPLSDSMIYTSALKYNEAAWASSESQKEHWIKINFDQPEFILNIIIYWAFDKGTYFKSKNYYIECFDLNNKKLIIDNKKIIDELEGQTTYIYSRIKVSKILIKQNSNGGSKKRKGIMWIREVCIYG